MFPIDKGLDHRSQPLTWSDGSVQQLDMAFLHQSAQRMRAPVVREISFHGNFDISGVTAAFDNKDSCQLFSQIKITDRKGDIVRLPGKLIRLGSQMELGARAVEQDGLADAASGATTTGDDMILRVTFDQEYAAVGADFGLPLLHLVDGGQIEIQFGTPFGSTGVSGKVYVYVHVHDEGKKETKSRLVRRAQAVSLRDASYPIGGSVRELVLASNPTAAGYSNWTTATYNALNVPELELSVARAYILRENYRRLRPDTDADDVILAGQGVPLVIPSKGQRLDKMPDLKSVHIDLGSDTIPTSAQLYMSYVEDRDTALAAQWLGYNDVSKYLADVQARGVVNLGKGRKAKVAEFPSHLARRLPISIE